MVKLKKSFYKKKVLITGHTGFKGSWLSLWLAQYGANILGISNNISKPSNYVALNLSKDIKSKIIDLRDLKKIKRAILHFQPDFIFHLAAQSLVKKSYEEPVSTFSTNSIGTLNILESVRYLKKKCTTIIITSDKSYKNMELNRGYKENDLLGGIDPYSASKASAEMVIFSYFNSFLKNKKNLKVGIARAGNVVGGGDWSKDRLIPDCIKSWSKNKKAILRNPKSTRPWQHVLEAVGAYIIFANKLENNSKLNGEVFNFGPNNYKNFTVLSIIKKMKKNWDKVDWKIKRSPGSKKYYESKLLQLNCNKAKTHLKWKSVLSIDETISMTVNWYKKYYTDLKNIKKFSLSQIKFYEELIQKRS